MKALFRSFREIFHRDLVRKMNELQDELCAISGKLNDLNTPPNNKWEPSTEEWPLLQQGYAQFGEDLIMARVLKDFFLVDYLEKVKYLEIGTHSPHWSNSTFYFYRKGARGVLVEPNPVFCREIKQIRPEDTLIEKGVSFNNEKSMVYYEFDKEEGRNTFEKEVADQVVRSGIAKVLRKTELPMVTINEILETYFDDNRYFDILQIDAEGMDFDIIKSMDFSRFHPKVVCMEMGVDVNNHIINYGKKDMVCDYMQKINYECIASTTVNLIFINRGFPKTSVLGKQP